MLDWIGAAVAAAAGSTSFNLVCTGTDDRIDQAPSLGDYTRATPTSEPFTEVYRVDLARRRWCSGECKGTRALYSLTPDTITFQFDKAPPYTFAFVSRETGEYVREAQIGTIKSFQWGKCQRASFSGFPRQKF